MVSLPPASTPPPDDVTVSRYRPREQGHTAAAHRLQVVWPAHLAGPLPVTAGQVRLGRSAGDGALALPDHTVSRVHCILDLAEGAGPCFVRDAGSRNGTFLNGARIADIGCVLRSQAVLRIGDVLMVYERAAEGLPGSETEAAELPGTSVAAMRLRAAVQQIARGTAPVLVVGETGTGKEYVARALHRLSGRGGPFLAVNCAALAPQLIESQLFGHARGAFTGAHTASPGLFRSAAGGTLLLDEIGELPLELQPKLLRVLQENEVHPVGESRPVRTDVRVVAATLVDLELAVESGRFRRDLYARLRLAEITVPPLRDRRADVLSWFALLGRRWATEGEAAPGLTPDLVERLLLDAFPENLRTLDRYSHLAVRQRDAFLEALRAPVPASDETSEAPAPSAAPRPPKPTREEMVELLAKHEGSVHAVARALARDRKQVYRWLAEYGLQRP
jgi:DNA-binding NtrC family response regulator